jgi:ribosomal protein S18 acetylase RimI-like enzyme
VFVLRKAHRITEMLQTRPCRSEDFDAVLVLLKQLWPEKSFDPDALRTVFNRALTSDTQAYICSADDDKVIGFGSLTIKNNLWQEGYLAHVDELVVDAEYRSRGVGTILLEQLFVIARQRGCGRIELDSGFHRADAHCFYERQGFENRGYVFSKML